MRKRIFQNLVSPVVQINRTEFKALIQHGTEIAIVLEGKIVQTLLYCGNALGMTE